MNKIIKANSLGLSKEIRKSIKFIVDQLEHQNYAIISNPDASRIFAKFVPDIYRNNDTVIFTSTKYAVNKKPKNIITINPNYCIEKCDMFSFRIRLKK